MFAPLIFVAATAAATPRPLRHLEFSFHYSETQESISHYSGIESVLPGVDTTFTGGGEDGTIFVDVLGLGPNDTLVLNMRQEVPKFHSADAPAAQVMAYPTGQVDVPPNSIPLRQPELNLARFLGRKFVNGDYLDEKNHWHIDIKVPPDTAVSTDFTITKNTGGILDIIEAQRVAAGMSTMHTDGHIVYDMNRTVPLSIHEVSLGAGTFNGLSLTYDYALTADSLSPAKP